MHCAHLEMEREVGAREGEGELAGLKIGNQGTLSSGNLFKFLMRIQNVYVERVPCEGGGGR